MSTVDTARAVQGPGGRFVYLPEWRLVSGQYEVSADTEPFWVNAAEVRVIRREAAGTRFRFGEAIVEVPIPLAEFLRLVTGTAAVVVA